MCYACSSGDEGGPIGLRDWANWFRFIFKSDSVRAAGERSSAETDLCERALEAAAARKVRSGTTDLNAGG